MKTTGTPLSLTCICFCSGIITASQVNLSFVIFYLTALLFFLIAVFFANRQQKFEIFPIVYFFLAAALLKNSGELPNHHIARIASYKSESAYIIGVIDSDPAFQDNMVSFNFKAEKFSSHGSWHKVCGVVLARVNAECFRKDFVYGDRLFLTGKMYRPFFSKAGFNYRKYLADKGVYLVLSVKKGGFIKKLGAGAANPLKAFSFKIKKRFREIIIKHLSSFSAGVLNALILGDRQDLSGYLLDILMKTGTIHIIAISGFNVGIVAFIILLVLKIMKVPRKPRYILTAFLLILYCLLTGASAPVVRATIMACVLLFSYLFRREPQIVNSLALCAIIILIFNPRQLYEISFQLSFLSVLSIIWLSPKIESILFPDKPRIPLVRFLIKTFCASFSAWLGLLPLIAYHFKIVSPLTVLANMIIVPYSAFITISGFSFIIIGTLIGRWAAIFAAGNELFILILAKINALLAFIPGAYLKLPGVSFIYVLLYYTLLKFILDLFESS